MKLASRIGNVFKHFNLILPFAVLAVAGVASAETRVWKFDVGSGCWSNPDNWENGVPVAGDSVWITNEVSNAVITNDLGAMSLGSLNIYGSQAVTFGSPKLTLSGGLTTRNASIINCDLHITANFSLRCGDRPTGTKIKDFPQATCEPTFNGNITVADGKYLYITGDSGAQFNGTLTGKKAYLRNGTINWSSGQFYFNKPVWFKEISHYGADQSTFWFNAAGNKYEKFTADYANYYFLVPGAMDPDGVISFSDAGGDSNAIYKGYYLRADQTINRFGECTDPGSKDRHYFTANGAGKHIEVVARGTADGSSYVRMLDNMGFTWAPTGDYTQEFLNRTHTITGPLVVSNGTIKMSGTCSFKQVAKITVKANAKFHHASTEAAALNKVTEVVLEDGATFKVDSGASDPFTMSPTFVIGRNAKIDVASGATVSIGDVQAADGTFPGSGDYTGTGATGTRVDWVSGEGTVNVTSSVVSWSRATSGGFNDAANWNGGILPAAGVPAYITANGANYTVSLNAAPAANAGGLRLANDGVHTNVLAVSAAATFSGEKVEVSAGGCINVDEGGKFAFRPSDHGQNYDSFVVRDGGRAYVKGGYLDIGNLFGKVVLSGSDVAEGLLAIHSGTCRVHNAYSGGGLWIKKGGRLFMDGGLLNLHLYTNKYSPLTMAGGAMEVGGDAVVLIGGGIGFYFGEGTATFSGNAQLSYSDAIARLAICARNPNDVARVEFTGNSSLKLNGAIATYVGYENPAGAKSILRQVSSATSDVGAICGVGERNGYGEIDVESGRLHVGAYGLSIASNIHDGREPDGARPEGVVRVAGGMLSIDGSAAGKNEGRPSYGLVVGDGMVVSNGLASTSLHKGTLEITGGVVSNHAGLVSVGIGKAKGFVRQTGGMLISKTVGRATTIGSFGGEGEWTMDGGTASVPGNLFVGGCEISDWNKTSSDPMYNVTSGSYGRLSITNGTFSVGWYAFIGKNGTGLVEVGTGGVFNVGGNIDVRAGGTLKFVLGPEGAGRIHSNASLLVDENAKLVLDVSACGDRPGRYTLIDVESSLGEFRPENIEIVGRKEFVRYSLTSRNRKLRCTIGTGCMVIVY